MTLKFHTLGLFLVGAMSATQAFSVPLFAKWFEGTWSCTSNGRPATMEWHKEYVPVVCVKAPCPPRYEVYYIGTFTEKGGVKQSLRVASETKFDLEFLSGNNPEPWYLAHEPSLKVAVGHSKVDGERYALSCRQLTSPIPVPLPLPEPDPMPFPSPEEM